MSDADKRAVLRHFLATLAYRTQKALRGAPTDFGDFEAGNKVRTPVEIIRHMTAVLADALASFGGEARAPEPPAPLQPEVRRFHRMLEEVSDRLWRGDSPEATTLERLLQGPFSDAMTHVGQLALLRRLHGSPVPPENFERADVDPADVSENQPPPKQPVAWPERP
ncbi:MAG TPA: hypothetical protein VFQ22_09370 [Longimicrobiales bacterium]|nr:hypothetical protein [Longimicrobiales bacterium]